MSACVALAALAGWVRTARRLHHHAAELAQQRHRAATLQRDGLTGLLRREAFHERAPGALATGNALALLDLDQFKAINDTHGHAAGDAVLCAVANRLVIALDRYALIARLGGDEFVLITSLDPANSHEQLQQLTSTLSAPVAVPDVGELEIGVSLGVVWLSDLPAHNQKNRELTSEWSDLLSEAMAAADAAMYQAKALSHTWRLHDPARRPARPARRIDPAPIRRYRTHGRSAFRAPPTVHRPPLDLGLREHPHESSPVS